MYELICADSILQAVGPTPLAFNYMIRI